jgi:hypothetical protein
MKKKIWVSLLFLHITPIYHNDVTIAEIIQTKNFPKESCPNKEGQSQRSLRPRNALLPRERGINVSKKNLAKGFDLKRSYFLVPSQPTLAKTLKREETESTSQSCTNLVKLLSQ